MIHPLFRLLATQPQLLAEHLAGYAALVGIETQQLKNRLLKQLVLAGLAVCLLGVATALAGVAVMSLYVVGLNRLVSPVPARRDAVRARLNPGNVRMIADFREEGHHTPR